jgi:signal transduction histidine kinase
VADVDLLTALLARLAPHISEGAESSTEAASALEICAAEVRRFADQAKEEDAHEGLELLSDLLLEVAVLIERNERRWSRLAFDLHDGALQEVAALRMDLHAFRSRLRKSPLAETSRLDRLAEFMDELDARLQRLDGGLRELVESFESPALADQPFEESVRAFVREFAANAEISVTVDIRGNFDPLSRSQRIALFRILVEAMANVRQHSGADRAWVTVRVQEGRARLRVRDNGKGFDVKRTPRRAAKRGRRGLVGMAERVRLLGGQFDVGSKPGGPTTITVTIPAGHVEELQPVLERRARKAARQR